MCGIVGFCNLPLRWRENVNRMNERMYHRGPNANGVWSNKDATVVLGHQRLSIVDLSPTGAQPMQSHSGRMMMVFNGEIYNYKEMAQKLIEEGYVQEFRGSSDTEVLLEAIEAYGAEEAINQCIGMFALAVYDIQEEKIYLLRDRVGEKPLYYGFVQEGFVFASDIGSISVMEQFQNPINLDILDTYFVHGYIPAPFSIYQNIYKLEPGTILEIAAPYQTWKLHKYWSMKEVAKKGQQNLFRGNREEAANELERLLKESIAGQMVADVPVGAFLSAGIDSSTVVSLMQSLSSQKVRTFTIGMQDETYNEAIIAKEIANHLGTEHTELYMTEQDAKEAIPKLSHMFSEPFADSSQIPTYLVSKMTREHVTVSLSGDGGDELFCGYNTYESLNALWNRMKQIPTPVRRLSGSLILHSPLQKKHSMAIRGRLLRAGGIEELYRISNEQDNSAIEIPGQHGSLRFPYLDYESGYLQEPHHNLMLMDMLMYHPDDILAKVDRTGMAVSLESRVPMLDKRVVEFAWTLPIEYLRQNGTGKLVLRDVLYRYVPKEMLDRPKTGFAIPIEKWLKTGPLREWAEALLNRQMIEQQGILCGDVVEKLWNDYTKRGIWRIQIWYLLMFQEWLCTEYRRK